MRFNGSPVIITGSIESVEDWIGLLVIAFVINFFAYVVAAVLLEILDIMSMVRRSRIVFMLAGFLGAVAGNFLGARLYDEAYGPTPAIVYYLGGAVAGGLVGISLGSLVWMSTKLARKLVSKMYNMPEAANSDQPQRQASPGG